MFDRIFANYLFEKGKLSEKNLTDVFSIQEEKRVRLGVIAISEKLMSIEQVEEVNQLQAVLDKRFGDIAIDQGYLTNEQVDRLLFLQGNSFLAFIQSVLDLAILSMEDINEELDSFQKEYGLTLSNMEDFKSCDIDRIIPIYLFQQPELLSSLCGVMIRTITRLVDFHAYIKKPFVTNEYAFPSICMQEIDGDHMILTTLSGNPEAMKGAAVGFAGAEYIDEEEDSLDALCELINCVNGLFATDMSLKNVDIDMKAPHYELGSGSLKAKELLCLPIVVYGKEIIMATALDTDYSI